jgi:hypothetical protein
MLNVGQQAQETSGPGISRVVERGRPSHGEAPDSRSVRALPHFGSLRR